MPGTKALMARRIFVTVFRLSSLSAEVEGVAGVVAYDIKPSSSTDAARLISSLETGGGIGVRRIEANGRDDLERVTP